MRRGTCNGRNETSEVALDAEAVLVLSSCLSLPRVDADERWVFELTHMNVFKTRACEAWERCALGCAMSKNFGVRDVGHRTGSLLTMLLKRRNCFVDHSADNNVSWKAFLEKEKSGESERRRTDDDNRSQSQDPQRTPQLSAGG